MSDVSEAREPGEYEDSWQALVLAEEQTAAAVALGRFLLRDPRHPSRPIFKLETHGLQDGLGLMIWPAYEGTDGVLAWAALLGSEVTSDPGSRDPRDVHYAVLGVLDGVPIHAWQIVTEPITSPTVCWVESTGWRVDYTQGGVERSVSVADAAAADAWIAQYVTKAVAA